MRKFLYILPLFISCISFPTSYDRIEPDKVRLLDFVYEPAEAVPGDTVSVKAIFSGRKIMPTDLTWKISYTVVTNLYGVNTALDTHLLEQNAQLCSFSDSTTCISFDMVIPDDILQKNPTIPENWQSELPDEFVNSIPEPFRSMDKKTILDSIHSLANLVNETDENLLQLITGNDNTLSTVLPHLLQALSVQIRLYAQIKGAHTIQSNYIVRYNNRFSKLSQTGIYSNINPVIDSIGVYKVKGKNLFSYNPEKNKHNFFRLYETHETVDDAPAIPIEKGYSYFLAAFTSQKDKEMTIEGNIMEEQHWTQWYYQLDATETEGVSVDDYMDIGGMGDSVSQLIVPADKRIKSFVLWLKVTDRLLNVINRPQGSTVKEFKGRFEYR